MKSFGPPRNHISGRDYTTAIRGRKLTDSLILTYILRGYYGEERRLRALEAQKKTPRVPSLRSPSLALALLKSKVPCPPKSKT